VNLCKVYRYTRLDRPLVNVRVKNGAQVAELLVHACMDTTPRHSPTPQPTPGQGATAGSGQPCQSKVAVGRLGRVVCKAILV
jgi:hypothetical protein